MNCYLCILIDDVCIAISFQVLNICFSMLCHNMLLVWPCKCICVFIKAILFAILQTMLAAIKMEVMTPSTDTPDEGNLGKAYLF